MRISEHTLGFIGFGHMAQVLFQGIDQAKILPRSQILFHEKDAQKMKASEQKFHLTSTSLKNLIEKATCIIIAVRPDQIELLLEDLALLSPSPYKTLITIAAGIPIEKYQSYIQTPICRLMPNVAAEVKESMSVFAADPKFSKESKELVRFLFSCVGEVIEVKEELMDISTAIAGSGPGFVFALIQAVARAGQAHGLSQEQALKMAAQSFHGASKLILKGKNPTDLLDKIATPNGTTEAGLKALKRLQINSSMQEVINESKMRSEQICKELSK